MPTKYRLRQRTAELASASLIFFFTAFYFSAVVHNIKCSGGAGSQPGLGPDRDNPSSTSAQCRLQPSGRSAVFADNLTHNVHLQSFPCSSGFLRQLFYVLRHPKPLLQFMLVPSAPGDYLTPLYTYLFHLPLLVLALAGSGIFSLPVGARYLWLAGNLLLPKVVAIATSLVYPCESPSIFVPTQLLVVATHVIWQASTFPLRPLAQFKLTLLDFLLSVIFVSVSLNHWSNPVLSPACVLAACLACSGLAMLCSVMHNRTAATPSLKAQLSQRRVVSSTPSTPSAEQTSAKLSAHLDAILAAPLQYKSRAKRHQVRMKINWAEPEQLPEDFVNRLTTSLADHGSILQGVAVRRGCIEIILSVRDMDMSDTVVNRGQQMHMIADLLNNMQLPEPGTETQLQVALDDQIFSFKHEESVLGTAWVPAGAKQGQLDIDSSGVAEELNGIGAVEPLFVVRDDLASCKASSSCAGVSLRDSFSTDIMLQLQLLMSDSTAEALAAASYPRDAAEAGTHAVSAPGPQVVSWSQNGFIDISVQKVARSAAGAGALASGIEPDVQCHADTPGAMCSVVLQASIGTLGMTRSPTSCGTVSVALTHQGRLGPGRHVLVLGPGHAELAAELDTLHLEQRAAVARADWEAVATINSFIQDLGDWLQLRSYGGRPSVSSSPHPQAPYTPAALAAWSSDHVQGLQMHLLQYAVDKGWTAVASSILAASTAAAAAKPPASQSAVDMSPAGLLMTVPQLAAASAQSSGGLGLLHRAVRSRSPEMVDLIMRTGAVRTGQCLRWRAPTMHSWVLRDHPSGASPLELAALVADGGILASHVLEAFPQARAAWHRKGPGGRPSPAQLAAGHGNVVEVPPSVWLSYRLSPQTRSLLHSCLFGFANPADEAQYRRPMYDHLQPVAIVHMLLRLGNAMAYAWRCFTANDDNRLFCFGICSSHVMGLFVILCCAIFFNRLYRAKGKQLWMIEGAWRAVIEFINAYTYTITRPPATAWLHAGYNVVFNNVGVPLPLSMLWGIKLLKVPSLFMMYRYMFTLSWARTTAVVAFRVFGGLAVAGLVELMARWRFMQSRPVMARGKAKAE